MSDLSAFPITRKWPPRHPDRLQLYSLTTPNGAVTHYAYDALNRLTGVQGPGSGLTTYGYDAGGRLATTVYAPSGAPSA